MKAMSPTNRPTRTAAARFELGHTGSSDTGFAASARFRRRSVSSDVGRRIMPILKCHKTMFYSQLDETLFFDGLKKIPAVKKIEGVGSDLLLSVPSRLPDKALRELLGLFFRYHVDMRQLAPFLTEKNRLWFHDPEKYWFKKVFSKR